MEWFNEYIERKILWSHRLLRIHSIIKSVSHPPLIPHMYINHTLHINSCMQHTHEIHVPNGLPKTAFQAVN
jgi:hypothetical protein